MIKRINDYAYSFHARNINTIVSSLNSIRSGTKTMEHQRDTLLKNAHPSQHPSIHKSFEDFVKGSDRCTREEKYVEKHKRAVLGAMLTRISIYIMLILAPATFILIMMSILKDKF